MQKKPQEAIPQLPLELQREILSRLPSESVLRFRRVCEDWNSETQHHTFVCSNISKCRQTNTQSRFVFKSKIYGRHSFAIKKLHDSNLTPPSISFPPEFSTKNGFHLICSGDGLFCFVKAIDGHFGSAHLCNPLLRQSVKLPEFSVGPTNIIGVGYDPRSKEIKVLDWVCGITGEEGYETFADLFWVCTVSTGNGRIGEWREVGMYSEVMSDYTHPVSLNGRIHWYGIRREFKSPDHLSNLNMLVPVIMSFDLHDEKFHVLSLDKLDLPKWKKLEYHRRQEHLAVGEVQGLLALMEEREDKRCIRVWTMENYWNNDSWSLKFSVDLTFDSPRVPEFCCGTSHNKFYVGYKDRVACYSPYKCNKCPVSHFYRNHVCVSAFFASLISLKGSRRRGSVITNLKRRVPWRY